MFVFHSCVFYFARAILLLFYLAVVDVLLLEFKFEDKGRDGVREGARERWREV